MSTPTPTPTTVWVLSSFVEGYPGLHGVYRTEAAAKAAAQEQSTATFGDDGDGFDATLSWTTADGGDGEVAAMVDDDTHDLAWLLQTSTLD